MLWLRFATECGMARNLSQRFASNTPRDASTNSWSGVGASSLNGNASFASLIIGQDYIRYEPKLQAIAVCLGGLH